MNPLQEQIGGSHYKNFKMQPIELITKTRCSFIQGNIVKYISRYKEKNGKQDLEKIIHYAKLALKLKNKGKIEEKCFTSRHICGKICACENNPHAAGCSGRFRFGGCQRDESCGGKNQWRYYNECNFYETAARSWRAFWSSDQKMEP